LMLSESEFTEFENFQNVDSVHLTIFWILIQLVECISEASYTIVIQTFLVHDAVV